LNTATRPETVAVTTTGPGVVPRMTFVVAAPPAFVVAVAGDTVALPWVTANVTEAPITGL
jgi:hypothetical protein